MGCLLPPSDAAIDVLYDVSASVIEGELHSKLREDGGATYDVSARALSMVGGTAYLFIKTTVGNDELPEAVTALREFWTGVTNQTWRSDFLLSDQMAEAAGHLFRYESSSAALAEKMFSDWALRWPTTNTDSYVSLVSAVRPGDAMKVIRGCADRLVVTATGDASVVEAAFRRRSTKNTATAR